jgi:ubiquinol-cytochrome c reductase cytochrome c subunit
MRRAALWAVAICGLAAAILSWSRPTVRAQQSASASQPSLQARGRALFLDACSACHGRDARGVRRKGPSLIGVGERSADFYLATGRMPLPRPSAEPVRTHPSYSVGDRTALVTYVGSLGGPPVPRVEISRGDIATGRKLFAEHCAGCHAVVAKGGIVPPGGIAPNLGQATPTQVAEAVRVGPYTMPAFGDRQISSTQLTSIARYVEWTHAPDNRGGWGIGNIGPVPEGMAAWFVGGLAILLIARLLGERTT